MKENYTINNIILLLALYCCCNDANLFLLGLIKTFRSTLFQVIWLHIKAKLVEGACSTIIVFHG